MTNDMVTPAQARAWLRCSQKYDVHIARIQELLSWMEDGSWKPEDHSPVEIVTSDGRERVKNGNHRMFALLLKGEPMPFLIKRLP